MILPCDRQMVLQALANLCAARPDLTFPIHYIVDEVARILKGRDPNADIGEGLGGNTYYKIGYQRVNPKIKSLIKLGLVKVWKPNRGGLRYTITDARDIVVTRLTNNAETDKIKVY